MFKSNDKKYKSLINKQTIFATCILLTSFIAHLYISKPLPDDFPQPWKYRLICYGADILAYMANILESFNICHRVDVTRLAYHLTFGIFNIRNANDNIQVIDDYVGDVPIRIYKPLNSTLINSNGNIPVIFYYHGGGYFLGSADICEPISYLVAKHTESLVIYVEFRLIPEHKYPAALNDSLLTTKQILAEHKKYNIDLDNVILLGDSAGGNLASVINKKLIEENILRPKLKVLIYPILQFFDFTLPSYIENMPKRVLGNIDRENFKHFIHYFTGYKVDDTIFENGHLNSDEKESLLSRYVSKQHLPIDYLYKKMHLLHKTKQSNGTIDENLKKILLHSDVSPLLVDNTLIKEYSAMYTYVLTVGQDILRDDGFIYVDRLRNSGIQVKHEHYENLFHGIFGFLHGPLEFDYSHALMQNVCHYIRHIINTK